MCVYPSASVFSHSNFVDIYWFPPFKGKLVIIDTAIEMVNYEICNSAYKSNIHYQGSYMHKSIGVDTMIVLISVVNGFMQIQK